MRALPNWLESYLVYTENQESPEELHLWTGLALLSAALRRKVWIDRGTYELFPNLYIITVAESAKIRKSAAVNIGIKLLKDAIPDLPTLSDSATPEGIVKHVNRTIMSEGEVRHKESHIFIHADELATLFSYDKQRASRLSILLTQMFNCPSKYETTLKSEAQMIIHNCYPTLLAATDPFNLKVLPEDAIGGFLGRCIFVTGKKRRRNIAWPEFSGDNLHDKLLVDLARIGSLSGEVTVPGNTREHFSKWYDIISEVEITDRRLAAFHQRMHDTALKLATLLCVASSNSLILDLKYLQAAIAIVEAQKKEFAQIQDWSTGTNYAQNRTKFIDLMRRNGGIATKKLVLRQLAISIQDFNALKMALEEEGTIREVLIDPSRPSEIFYKFTADEILRQQGGA